MPPGLETLRLWVMNAAALILVLTPPLMWLGPTKLIYGIFMGTGMISGLIYCLLARFDEEPDGSHKYGPPPVPDAFFAELIDVGTLAAHNRMNVEGGLRARMNRLNRLANDERMRLFFE